MQGGLKWGQDNMESKQLGLKPPQLTGPQFLIPTIRGRFPVGPPYSPLQLFSVVATSKFSLTSQSFLKMCVFGGAGWEVGSGRHCPTVPAASLTTASFLLPAGRDFPKSKWEAISVEAGFCRCL